MTRGKEMEETKIREIVRMLRRMDRFYKRLMEKGA